MSKPRSTPAANDTSADELVARARDIAPRLRERQEETERLRHIPAESIAEMLDAGLYRVQQPKSFGGVEHGLDDFVRVAIEIAAGCGSTGWVFSTGAQHQWQIGLFPPEAQHEMWGENPRALSASSYAPTGTAVPVEGGYRVNGRWSFCSGVDICQWMILGTRILDAQGDKQTGAGFILVPARDYRIVENWDVFGLIGTGSNDLEIEDAFVPAHRLLTHADSLSGDPPGAAINPAGLYRIPFFGAISYCLCAAVLGMARGALEEYLLGMRDRMTRGAAVGGARSVAEFETIQLRVGEASSAIDAATAMVLEDCRRIMDIVNAGETLSMDRRARNKGNIGYAARLCVRAVDQLFDSVGGAGLYNRNRVQRMWRDLHAGAQHISMNWDSTGTLNGRVRLGLEPGPVQF